MSKASHGNEADATPSPAKDDSRERLALLGRHLAEAAHDLRNPLASILALSELLGREDPNLDRGEIAGRIRANALVCRALVEDLLALTSGGRLARTTVDLGELVADTLAQRGPSPPGVEIVLAAGLGLPRTLGSPDRLRRLVENLVANAEAALSESGRRGRVTVSVREIDEPLGLRLLVEDDGPGIPKESLPDLFRPFASNRAEGTGLGLAIAKAVAEEHGGDLIAENRPEGGARFVATIPVLEPETAAETPRPRPSGRIDGGPPLHILAVDDDRNTLDTYRRVLELDGHLIETESSGVAGLERYLEGGFDVAIVDVRLPDLSGPRFHAEVLRRARELAGRLVFATGDFFKEDTRSFLNATGNPYLVKPFEIDELRAALKLASGAAGRRS